ncbi:F-box protein At1g61340-like [Raphanus sativus]|uniref:F-box protein At1g61340-like n=1 Tax=Raphanus sativus TaxID=3726 RepID=A0A6J0JKB0_RAPSA|nr:F-box protein At1g61340-like [Raphanus sativus]
MALRKKILGVVKSSSNTNRNVGGDDGGLGLMLDCDKYKKGYRKKRVWISSDKIRDSRNICKKIVYKSQELETLPQDILIRIICGVEHGDLKQLFNVSKTIREATLIAKKYHFEYSTPRKTLFLGDGFDTMINLEDDIEVPLVKKHRLFRITCQNKVSKISVALFK